MSSKTTTRSRQLRSSETKTEKLLWALLRNRQVCGLKFRRQHPIAPFYADFACVEHNLVVEIDGDYHNLVVEDDKSRERILIARGWSVLRVSCDQVEENPDGVGYLIAEQLGLRYEFCRR